MWLEISVSAFDCIFFIVCSTQLHGSATEEANIGVWPQTAQAVWPQCVSGACGGQATWDRWPQLGGRGKCGRGGGGTLPMLRVAEDMLPLNGKAGTAGCVEI